MTSIYFCGYLSYIHSHSLNTLYLFVFINKLNLIDLNNTLEWIRNRKKYRKIFARIQVSIYRFLFYLVNRRIVLFELKIYVLYTLLVYHLLFLFVLDNLIQN